MNRPSVRRAVFPAAGLGTRFLPATKAVQKELLPLVDRPLVEYAVREATAAGIEELIFVVAAGKDGMQRHLLPDPALERILRDRGKDVAIEAIMALELGPDQLTFVVQEEPLGLGHAVWCARHHIGDEPFAVLLIDDVIVSDRPCLGELIDVYEAHGGNVVAVEEVPLEETARYGIVAVGEDDGRTAEVTGLVEKPSPSDAPSNLAIVGRYILQPAVLEALGKTAPASGGEIQLTDAMAQVLGTQPLNAARISGRRFDCGTKLGFVEANLALALGRNDLGDVRFRLEQLLRES